MNDERKPRRTNRASVLRGPKSIHGRVPIRRLTIEFSEAAWAALKRKSVATGESMGRLIEDACVASYGRANESDIVRLYAEMEGVELPESPPATQPATQWSFSTFVVDSSTLVNTKPAIVEVVKSTNYFTKPADNSINANSPESAFERVKCSSETIRMAEEFFGVKKPQE